MTPLLETMARNALANRVERLEAMVRTQADLIGLLVNGLHHHLQDRHDAVIKSDDAPDVLCVVRARRTLPRLQNPFVQDIGDVSRSETSRGKPVRRGA